MDEPVFLTKNGRGRYVLVDIEEYERMQATIKLLFKLSEACPEGAGFLARRGVVFCGDLRQHSRQLHLFLNSP